ncbi:MAG: hypothetical protein FWG39_03645 [Alphaproteobacteria bacterium]|nr:hypothetical protein [Alphaproteobacteria bacterium]
MSKNRNLINWKNGIMLGILALCIAFSACQNDITKPERPEPPEPPNPPAVVDTLRYGIRSAKDFISEYPAIIDAAGEPDTWVIIDVASIGTSSPQIDSLGTGASMIYACDNIELNWTDIWPIAAGTLLRYENQWLPLGAPPLAANPHKWLVTDADLPLFTGAGQGAAVQVAESVTDTLRYDIASVDNFLERLPEIRENADEPLNFVIINFASLGVAADQMESMTAGVDGLRGKANVELNPTNIWPLAERTPLSYQGHWVRLDRPPLRANPHKWEVTEQDLPLFQNAGYGNAVEVADPEIIIVPFNISSAQDFLNQMAAINSAAVQPNTQVNVNVASIGVSESQLAPLTNGVDGIRNRPNVDIVWTDIYPTAPRILFEYSGNWILLQNPPLRPGMDRWMVSLTDLALFQEAGQRHGVAPQRASVNYDDPNFGPDGEILLPENTALANTIVWNRHLADAANLEYAVDWGQNVQLVIQEDINLPGYAKALGGATNKILRALHTQTIPTGGNLRASRLPIVTSFSYRDSFDPDFSIGGYPAAPMKIDHLGDEGDTNWAMQHLIHNWNVLGGSTLVVPHVQSTRPDGRIYFEPGGHHPDQHIPQLPHLAPDPQRSRYRLNWFSENWPIFRIGVPNNITIVIQTSKLTLCGTGLAPYGPDEWAEVAYFLLEGNFEPSPASHNVELPTLQDVKADASTQNSR